MLRFLIFLLIPITLYGCSVTIDNEEKEIAAISKAAKDFSQAYVDGDLEAQMEFYTKDAVIVPGSRNMIEGIDEVTRYWTTPSTVDVLEHKTTSTRLEISGNMASDYGYYEGTTLRSGDTINFRGQYVIVWKKGEDGKWRMAVDMWSSLNN